MNREMVMKLSPADFQFRMQEDFPNLLIDVREKYEYEDFNLGGVNIPMGEVLSRSSEFENYTYLFLCCATGKRSFAIGYHLVNKLKGKVIYSLTGGIDAIQNET